MNVWPWVQSCRPKGHCFPFIHSWKIEVEGSIILGDLNWKFFKVSYPVGTHTDMNFLLRVSVTDHLTVARLILGRWKERSLGVKPLSLSVLQGVYIQTNQRIPKYILTAFHPVQRLKLKKEKNLLHKKPSRKIKGNQQSQRGKCIHKSSARMNL